MKFCDSCGQLLPFDGARAWVEPDEPTLVVDGRRVQLTVSEAELMRALMDAAPRVVTRGHIMDRIYGLEGEEPIDHIISVFICKIKVKIAGTALEIENIWGKGYRAVLDD